MTDWSYDLFYDDMKKYNATPRKGVHCSSNADSRESFVVWFKNEARDFKADWIENGKKMYDPYEGWIGDAFARILSDMCFSDFYKDTYGQRPHLPVWFYVHLLELPMNEDTARLFCANPIKEAINDAQTMRNLFD